MTQPEQPQEIDLTQPERIDVAECGGAKRFEYDIKGRKFIQEELVPGQAMQIADILAGLKDLPWESREVLIWMKALDSHVFGAAAAVICPDGEDLEKRDMADIARHLKWRGSIPDTMRIIRDFFVLRPALESACRPLLMEITGHLAALLPSSSVPTSPPLPKATPSGGGKSRGAAGSGTSPPTPGG